MELPQFTALHLELSRGIAEIRLNRPERANAMNAALWAEIRQAFAWADENDGVRVVILSGAGKNFCAGIDLALLLGVQQQTAHPDGARSREKLRRVILDLQDCLSSIERCRKPVVAAIQGACVGGALDLVTCCDLRYAAGDAYFSVKEVDVGMVADVGTLQRLPRIVGEGRAREMAYTGRNVAATEAEAMGLVNGVCDSREALDARVRQLAAELAAKSPLALRGIKEVMNFSRDHSVADGLQYVATWNAAMLVSADLGETAAAQREGRLPVFLD